MPQLRPENHLKRLQYHYKTLRLLEKKHTERIKELEERVSILEKVIWSNDENRDE